MFAWFRRIWNNGQVPARPRDCLLDWPDEEFWVFDYDAWKWVAEPKVLSTLDDDGWEDQGDDEELILIDDVPPPQCCGGTCHIPPPPPPVTACCQDGVCKTTPSPHNHGV